MPKTALKIIDWGLTDYQEAFARQAQLVQQRLGGEGMDTLVLVEHPPTVTMGRRTRQGDLHYPEQFYAEQGISLQKINRGGLATAHEPGQLVAYPLILLKKRDLRWYADQLLQAVIDLLADYGLRAALKPGEPGVWVEGRKICSFGIALKRWIASHGIALNLNNSLTTFDLIVPCGQPGEKVTSLAREVGCAVSMEEAKGRFVEHFCAIFNYDPKL
jgi:lipoate-protein ligase B